MPFCKQSLNPPVLLFVQNKERAKELYNEMKFDDIRAGAVHADLSQEQVKQPLVILIFEIPVFSALLNNYLRKYISNTCIILNY